MPPEQASCLFFYSALSKLTGLSYDDALQCHCPFITDFLSRISPDLLTGARDVASDIKEVSDY